MSGDQLRSREYQLFHQKHRLQRRLAFLKKNIFPHIRSLPRNSEILEIGPGQGELLHFLRENGFAHLRAHEICSEFAQSLNDRGFDTSSESSIDELFDHLSENTFDVIILIDVLEHLDFNEAVSVIHRIYSALKQGGILILQVPNCAGLFGLGIYSSDPTHQLMLNESSLPKLLKKEPFERVMCHPSNCPDTFFDFLRMIPQQIIFFIMRFLIRLIGAGYYRILTANLICVARK